MPSRQCLVEARRRVARCFVRRVRQPSQCRWVVLPPFLERGFAPPSPSRRPSRLSALTSFHSSTSLEHKEIDSWVMTHHSTLALNLRREPLCIPGPTERPTDPRDGMTARHAGVDTAQLLTSVAVAEGVANAELRLLLIVLVHLGERQSNRATWA